MAGLFTLWVALWGANFMSSRNVQSDEKFDKFCIGDPKATLAGTGEAEDLGTVEEPAVEACEEAEEDFFAGLDGY